jgi:Icc-related predicted phosphoesterase
MFGARPRRSLRVFFATDVHGSERCFRKFLAGAKAYDADVLILGGDIAAKGLVPIQASNGTLVAEVHGTRVAVPPEEEEELRASVNRLGSYAVIASQDDLARMQQDPAYVDALFRHEIVNQIEAWCKLAEERLPSNIRCIITPGNDDPTFIDEVLTKAPRIESPEGELCELGPVVLASCGDVTPTPWHTEREYTEEDLGNRIKTMLDAAPPDRRLVLNFHRPPFGSGLDLAPEIDAELRPVVRGGRPSEVPVGSKAVRDAILHYQPVVGLHGHIHEARGAQRIGKTICLNPGSDYTADVLRGALVDFAADGTCIDFLLTAG